MPALFLIVGCFFTIFFAYSIVSVELFGALNTYRCRLTSEPISSTVWQIISGYENYYCGNPDSCPVGTYCASFFDFNGYLEPLNTNTVILNYGITSFDNVMAAFITNFIIMTQDEWSKIMYMYWNGQQKVLSFVYFSLNLIGINLLLLHLILATILKSFYRNRDDEVQRDRTNKTSNTR